MSKGFLELINEVKSGSVEAFLQLIRRVEAQFSNIIKTSRKVWFSSDLVLIRNCTYILLDMREKKAYALVLIGDTYMVLSIDVKLDYKKSEQEIIDSICIYIDEIVHTRAI